MSVRLNIISVRMTHEKKGCQERLHISCKEDVEKGSKYRTLGETKRSRTPRRARRVKDDRARAPRKIGSDPEEW
jgi:hypothetical protein